MFRKARQSDAKAVYEIYFSPEVYPFMYYSHMPLQAFRKKWREILSAKNVFVLVKKNELAGYAALQRLEGRCSHVVDLSMFAVKPGMQGKGLGKKFLEWLIAKAKKMGAKRLQLLMESDNRKALTLYKKFGFKKEGRLEKFYRRSKGKCIDEIMLAKPV